MYRDIGKKMMDCMKVICVIAFVCMIISMIFEIITIAGMNSSQLLMKYSTDGAAIPIISSIFTHLLAAAGIYVGSWVLYAFGQLVDDIHAMRTKTEILSLDESKWQCSCGRTNPNDVFVCYCGQKGPEPQHVNNKEITNKKSEPVYAPRPMEEKPQILDQNVWQCSCGRTNPYYIVTCVCGKRKTEAK